MYFCIVKKFRCKNIQHFFCYEIQNDLYNALSLQSMGVMISGRAPKPWKPGGCHGEPPLFRLITLTLSVRINKYIKYFQLVWSFDESIKDPKRSSERADCASYELFVCTVRKTDTPDTKRLWQRIGGKGK